MKIIFKTENALLEEVENAEKQSDEIMDQLAVRYDNKSILKYEINFTEGVVVSQVKYFDDIGGEMIDSLVITVGQD
jgi:hypothetical protein